MFCTVPPLLVCLGASLLHVACCCVSIAVSADGSIFDLSQTLGELPHLEKHSLVHLSCSCAHYGQLDWKKDCWKPSSPFSNVHFKNTTKIAAQVLCSELLLLLVLRLFSNYELFMYFCFCFFFHSYGSFNHTTSTSLSFSESPELFLSISLLSQLIESHSAHSSARCHF